MYNPQITVDRIKQMLEIKGITLAELNEACGLNRNTITVSANSKTGLSAKILSNISEILGCSVDYLLGATDEPHSNTIQTGDNNSNISIGNHNNGDNQINVGTAPKSGAIADGLTSEFMEAFQGLSFPDKMEVMNLTMQKMQKGA